MFFLDYRIYLGLRKRFFGEEVKIRRELMFWDLWYFIEGGVVGSIGGCFFRG